MANKKVRKYTYITISLIASNENTQIKIYFLEITVSSADDVNKNGSLGYDSQTEPVSKLKCKT